MYFSETLVGAVSRRKLLAAAVIACRHITCPRKRVLTCHNDVGAVESDVVIFGVRRVTTGEKRCEKHFTAVCVSRAFDLSSHNRVGYWRRRREFLPNVHGSCNHVSGDQMHPGPRSYASIVTAWAVFSPRQPADFPHTRP